MNLLRLFGSILLSIILFAGASCSDNESEPMPEPPETENPDEMGDGREYFIVGGIEVMMDGKRVSAKGLRITVPKETKKRTIEVFAPKIYKPYSKEYSFSNGCGAVVFRGADVVDVNVLNPYAIIGESSKMELVNTVPYETNSNVDGYMISEVYRYDVEIDCELCTDTGEVARFLVYATDSRWNEYLASITVIME